MNNSLKVKLGGLGGVLLALVFASGCMGGGGGAEKEYGAVCGGFTRTCQDGSVAKKLDAEGCQQSCPEDKDILDKLGNAVTGTGTATGTGSSTATATQVNCSNETFACPDGSYVGRDPGNGCAFKACPAR